MSAGMRVIGSRILVGGMRVVVEVIDRQQSCGYYCGASWICTPELQAEK